MTSNLVFKAFLARMLARYYNSFLKEVHRANVKTIKRRYPQIHSSVSIGYETNIYGDGTIEVGEDTRIGNHCILETDVNTKITIGKRVLISHYVAIYTSNAQSSQDFSVRPLRMRYGDVRIGDYCWICWGVFIREGVHIGNNCIVAANSVVLHDVPAYSVVAGCPAKVVKKLR